MGLSAKMELRASALTLAERKRLHAQGVTLVIVEHNVPAVKALCERVVILSSGRKIADGAAAEALADPT